MFEYIKRYFYQMEKLQIRLGYDKKSGISIEDFIKQLDGINKDYSRFVGHRSEIYIEKITEGCISIDFVQHIIVPVMQEVVSTSVHAYGKHMISSLKLGSDKDKLKKHEINNQVKTANSVVNIHGGNNKIYNQVETAKNVVNIFGGDNTIYNLTIKADSSDPDKEKLYYRADSEELKKIYQNVTPLQKEEILESRSELHESVELRFTTFSDLEEEDKFRGIIEGIDPKVKKVMFESDKIKQEFKDSEFYHSAHIDSLATQSILVSVQVKFNPNGNIGSYIITEII